MKDRLLLLFMVFILFSVFRANKPILAIFTIGDSTTTSKNLYGGNPECGWRMVFPGFFSEDIRVDNCAASGRSSKSFVPEGRWARVISQVKEGDYAFIQFGHNDEKADSMRRIDPGTTFDDNLHRFVNETCTRGGISVLFNSIVRHNSVQLEDTLIAADARRAPGEQELPKGGNVLYDTHGAYLDPPRNVAKEMGVVFIDMSKIAHDLVQGLGPVESKRSFVFVEPRGVPALPKDREDSTRLNVYGARTIAGLTVDATAKEIPELTKCVRHYDYIVAQGGTDDFFTVQEAINVVPGFHKNMYTTILVHKGIYKEKIIIPGSKIEILPIGEDGAVLTNSDFTNKKNVFGENMGTSGSLSYYTYAPDFYVKNITSGNSTGSVGQAVTCFVSADCALFEDRRLLDYQDTPYTYGKHSRQYYEGYYIEGTADLIFGRSVIAFNHCHIHSRHDGYVMAPSTSQNKKYGYVFYNRRLAVDPDVAEVYPSRPRRPYVQVVFIRCESGKHILPEGWHNWRKKEAEKTVFRAGYDSHGEGANPKARTAFSRQLKSLKGYEVETVLAGEDDWDPLKNDFAK